MKRKHLQRDLSSGILHGTIHDDSASSYVGATERRFHNKSFSDLLFVEIFAGTARLSSAVHDLGFETMAVDRSAARSSKHHIALYDLTDPLQLQALLQVIREEADRIIAVHMAPACGTASRARERKLPKLQKKGFKVPQPDWTDSVASTSSRRS